MPGSWASGPGRSYKPKQTGAIPVPGTKFEGLAQLAERRPFKSGDAGSCPVPLTMESLCIRH